MMCAGWMRFRASLMAIRRTSWIDHRINDEAALVLFLPWFGVPQTVTRPDGLIDAIAHERHAGPHPRRRYHPGDCAIQIADPGRGYETGQTIADWLWRLGDFVRSNDGNQRIGCGTLKRRASAALRRNASVESGYQSAACAFWQRRG